MPTFADARQLAETLLAEHRPERWRHAQAAARVADRLSALVEVDRAPLMQAAVLHDVGHSPVVVRTGFPPLDAARFLATRGYDDRVVALVAHHSAAAVEARGRGVTGIDRFPDEATATRDALWFCDALSSPTGDRVEPPDRHGPTRLGQAHAELEAAVDRTRHRMTAGGIDLQDR